MSTFEPEEDMAIKLYGSHFYSLCTLCEIAYFLTVFIMFGILLIMAGIAQKGWSCLSITHLYNRNW